MVPGIPLKKILCLSVHPNNQLWADSEVAIMFCFILATTQHTSKEQYKKLGIQSIHKILGKACTTWMKPYQATCAPKSEVTIMLCF